MSVIRSFWLGWKRATILWPVVLLSYLVDTALAVLVAIPPAGQLSGVFGHSAMAPALLGPVSMDWLIELFAGTDSSPSPWLLYLLVPPLYLLLTTFLRGGLLGQLAADGTPFGWPDFFADCARFFWRLLLLCLFYLPGVAALAVIFLALSFPLIAAQSAGLSSTTVAGLRGAIGLLLFLWLLAALDYARVSLALEPRRSLWRHAARGFWFSLSRFYLTAPLAVAFAVAAALFAVAYPALVRAFPAFNDLWLALLVQQLSILALSWQRVATLGGEMALYRAA